MQSNIFYFKPLMQNILEYDLDLIYKGFLFAPDQHVHYYNYNMELTNKAKEEMVLIILNNVCN